MPCLFCKIASKEIPSGIVYEDDEMVAFKDIAPQAPVHVLVIPKKHFETLNDLTKNDTALISRMIFVIKKLACEFEIADSGYRTVVNCNQEGGQSVYHLHFHLLGGRQLGGSMVG